MPIDEANPRAAAEEGVREIDLERLHARDPELLERLIRETTPRIRAAIRSFAVTDADLDDIVQECWVRILEQLDKFTKAGSFPGWAVTVSRNYCRSMHREAKRAVDTVSIEDVEDGVDSEPNPEEEFGRGQIKQAVWQELNQLPDREREAVVMDLMEQRPTSEIARKLGVTDTSARKILGRGIALAIELSEASPAESIKRPHAGLLAPLTKAQGVYCEPWRSCPMALNSAWASGPSAASSTSVGAVRGGNRFGD